MIQTGRDAVITCSFEADPGEVYFAYVRPGDTSPIVDPGSLRAGSQIECVSERGYRFTVPTAGMRPGSVAYRFWSESGESQIGTFEVGPAETKRTPIAPSAPSAPGLVAELRDSVRDLTAEIRDQRSLRKSGYALLGQDLVPTLQVPQQQSMHWPPATAQGSTERILLGAALGIALAALVTVAAVIAGRRV